MAKFCGECGNPVSEEAFFCSECGTPLSPRGEPGAGQGQTGDAAAPPAQPADTPGTVLLGEQRVPDSPVEEGGEQVGHPESFGRYRVVREVGRGAMGIVYLARDDTIGRSVAVKTLRVDPMLSAAEMREVTERFEREARAAGMLSHPNVVTVYDVGDEGGTPYMAMEFLEGAPLGDIMEEGPMTIERAADVAAQVLSALDYAHGHGVVHRDIKPDNIFLLRDGRVKVADFGIAHLAGSGTMTQVGQVIGTPGYMSPEQVKGETVGPASDIFSTGVLLYEMVTGTTAFAGGSATTIMYKIVHEDIAPPRLANPGIPPYLEAVIGRATAKSPTSRFASAALMREALEGKTIPGPGAVAGAGTVLRADSQPGASRTVMFPEPRGAAPQPQANVPPAVQQAPPAYAPPAVEQASREKKKRGLGFKLAVVLLILALVGAACAFAVIEGISFSRRSRLTRKYNSAVSLLNSKDYAGAYPLLQEIKRQDPHFKDVEAKISYLEKTPASPVRWTLAEVVSAKDTILEVKVTNLLGRELTTMRVAPRFSYRDTAQRPDVVSVMGILLRDDKGAEMGVNLAATDEPQYHEEGRQFVLAQQGVPFEVDVGRWKYTGTVVELAVDPRPAFPQGYGMYPAYTALTVEFAIAVK
jgi:tRNA A-37 threonylcarbamoyl transferase component Bud32